MKEMDLKCSDNRAGVYKRPAVEIVEIKIEQGFAASSGANEKWDETPGGGDF